MRRPFLIGLLAFGTIAGYASGFHHLRYTCHHGCDRDWGDSRSAEFVAPPAPAGAPVQVVTPAPAPAQTLVIPIVITPGGYGPQAQPQPIIVTLPAQTVGAAPQAAQTIVIPPPVAAAPAPH